MKQIDDSSVEKPQTWIEHFVELRNRIFRTVIGLVLCFLVLAPFAQKLYAYVAQPLMNALPEGNQMIATEVIAPFFVPLKVTLMTAFLLSLPYTLYQVWSFVAPALYRNEKRLILPLVISSCLLFAIGMLFAYFLVFPVVFHFLAGVTPSGVAMATDIDKYLSFVLGMFVAFGLAFEVPIVVLLLHYLGVVSALQLATMRPYIIIGAFVVAAVITPPDILSQILLAVPLILLYEVGVQICRIKEKTKR